jgi:hypothetical protein
MKSMFYERQHKPRRGSLVILSEGFLCLRIDRKMCEHILVTPLENRSSPAIDYYGMGIYNNNTIMMSLYANSEYDT